MEYFLTGLLSLLSSLTFGLSANVTDTFIDVDTSTKPIQNVDLLVIKDVNPLSGLSGTEFNYTVWYGNGGSSKARSVKLVDSFRKPDDVMEITEITKQPTNGRCKINSDAKGIKCSFGNLKPFFGKLEYTAVAVRPGNSLNVVGITTTSRELGTLPNKDSTSVKVYSSPPVGIETTFVSSDALVLSDGFDGNDDDVGHFEIVFDVTARNGTVFIPRTSRVAYDATSTPNELIYGVYDSGELVSDDLADLITFTTPTGVTDLSDSIQIVDGATTRITLTVTQTNDSPEDDGIYYMELIGIPWQVAHDSEYEHFHTDGLDEFETPAIFLN